MTLTEIISNDSGLYQMGKREGAGYPVEEPSDKAFAYTIRMMRYLAMWPVEGDSKLYRACSALLCFNILVFVLLFSLVYFTDQQNSFALIENTGYILVMLPTFANVISLVTNRREYKEVISSIQGIISFRQSDPDDVVKSAVRNFLAQEKKMVTSYLSVFMVSTVCALLKPIIQIMLRIILEGTMDDSPASLTLPLKLFPPVLKAPGWRVFILQYVIQVAMVTMTFPMVIFLDVFLCLLIKYASHQLEVLNIVLEQFGQGEVEDFEINDNLTARKLGGEINKILALPQMDNIFVSKAVHTLEEGECVYMTSDVRNSRLGRQKYLEEALSQIASLHDGILRNLGKLSKLLSPVLATYYLVSSLSFCLILYNVKSDTSQVIIGAAMIMSLTIRLLILSYFSSELTHQSLAVSDSAYFSNWHFLGSSGRRTIVVIMCRAQKPAIMRAGFFAVMSLQTFLSVMQCAYSYYNVLAKMDSS